MGTFTVPIEVGNLEGNRFVAMDALVDTGAIYCMVPRDLLAEVGVLSDERDHFSLADDSMVELDLGYSRIRFEQRRVIAQVIFAPEGSMPLLGATALENARLAVDPVNKRLVPIIGLLKPASGGNGQFPAGP